MGEDSGVLTSTTRANGVDIASITLGSSIVTLGCFRTFLKFLSHYLLILTTIVLFHRYACGDQRISVGGILPQVPNNLTPPLESGLHSLSLPSRPRMAGE